MKQLSEKVRSNGYTYFLYKRGKKVCIYVGRHYEVFLIRTRPEEIIMGKHYPEREVYPPYREWGKTAWTFIKLENALKKFDKLENQ